MKILAKRAGEEGKLYSPTLETGQEAASLYSDSCASFPNDNCDFFGIQSIKSDPKWMREMRERALKIAQSGMNTFSDFQQGQSGANSQESEADSDLSEEEVRLKNERDKEKANRRLSAFVDSFRNKFVDRNLTPAPLPEQYIQDQTDGIEPVESVETAA